jgi:hypothetical protein
MRALAGPGFPLMSRPPLGSRLPVTIGNGELVDVELVDVRQSAGRTRIDQRACRRSLSPDTSEFQEPGDMT